MENFKPPKGLISELITPMESNGDIDGRGLGRHLDSIIPYVQALYLASPHMGEGTGLNPEQREQLLEKAIVVVREAVPVFFWISAETAEDTKKIIILLDKRLKKRKYTGPVFWVDTPLFYHSNRGLPDLYKEIASLTWIPLIIQNDPAFIKQLDRPFKRTNIRTGILKELVLNDCIRGMIFWGSLDRAYNYQTAVKSKKQFRIYDGDENSFLIHPGKSGVVSSGSNILPAAWNRITMSSLNLNGDQYEYQDQLRQIWEIGAQLSDLSETYYPNSPNIIKQVLYETGVIRSPMCTVKPQDTETLDEKIKILKSLMQNRMNTDQL